MSREKTQPLPVRPVDLEIRITTPWGLAGQSLQYELSSPSQAVDVHHRTVAGPRLHDPEGFQKRYFDQLEELQSGKDARGRPVLKKDIENELRTLGHDLYQSLFSSELRALYREFRHRVTSLLITSDEPWIPWEMLRPNEFDDDDFLCARFELGRWLAGDRALIGGKVINRWRGLAANAGGDLSHARGEIGQVETILIEAGLDQEKAGGPVPAGSCDFVEILDAADFDLLHFAGHGHHDQERPAEADIQLDDRLFLARHFSPEAEKKLRERRPFVFFNACQVGRLNQSLTGMDGWAARWIQRCGCSAYLAPLWPVRDHSASYFAASLYRGLIADLSLGQAVAAARKTVRQQMPGSMAWLAYSFYGNPNARILFGERAQVSPAPLAPPTIHLPPPPPRETAASSSRSSTAMPGADLTRAEPASDRPILSGPPKSAGWPPAARMGAWLTAGALVVGLGLRLEWPPSETPRGPDTTKSSQTPIAPEEEPDAQESDALTEAANLGLPKRQEPASEAPPPPPPPKEIPKASIPTSQVVPGKLGILVLDQKTKKIDFDLALQVEDLLRGESPSASPFIPSVSDSTLLEPLTRGDLSMLTDSASTPWGSEYLLVSTVDRSSLAQSSPQFKGVSLTMRSRLIHTPSRSTKVSSTETHTGKGTSLELAIAQAAGRCLQTITDSLKQGANDENQI